MEREIRRARNYLSVLLVIWVPNLAVNLYHFVFLPQDKEPYFPVQALVLLTSLQGFINFLVYMWGYRPFQQWLTASRCMHLLPCPGHVDDHSERGSAGLLLLDSDEGDSNSDGDGDDGCEDQAEKEPLRKSILATSPLRDSALGGSRARIASGERAVRFEERHECRYYDADDHTASSSEVSAFMPRTGYYASTSDSPLAASGGSV
jgi:hypothetical protein